MNNATSVSDLADDQTATVRVWDPLVRFGHWVLMGAFFVAYFSEDDFMTIHVWAGYTVATVLVIRVLWGFVGTRHARFRNFVRSPVETLAYLGDLARHKARRYIGHNPAGAAMVMALLLGISTTAFSGLMLYAIEEGSGPLAGWVTGAADAQPIFPAIISTAYADDDDHYGEEGDEDDAREEFWEEIHEISANFVLLLVGIHILGVLYSSFLHDENLVRSMFTGRKRL